MLYLRKLFILLLLNMMQLFFSLYYNGVILKPKFHFLINGVLNIRDINTAAEKYSM
jgi:hypothetical protein